MLESLEGRRGEVRAKPPIPALEGLFGLPTVVNNVLTLAAVPMILADGGAAYAELGTGFSRGTQVFQLAGNIAQGGIVEADFGITLRELVEDFGGGTRSGRPVRAVQVGGPLGAYLPADRLDLADGLRGVLGSRRHARPRRCRRVRRHLRRRRDGAVRDGVLRGGVVREVHTVPRRLDPGRGGHRPDPRGRGPRCQPRPSAGPLHDDGAGVAVRHGRPDPHAGPQCAAPLRLPTSLHPSPATKEHDHDGDRGAGWAHRGRLRHAGSPRTGHHPGQRRRP